MPNYIYPDNFDGTFWTIVDGDYYVSTIGNDITGDGSPQNPYLTIAKAFELAIDGEKIVIGPDEYITVDNAVVEQTGAELSCRLATTINIDLATGGLVPIDGISTANADRILVWKQSVPSQNGIYIASPGPWFRAEYFNSLENMTNGALVPVLEGNSNAKSIFQHTTTSIITVNTTSITFEKVAITKWGEMQGDINEQEDLLIKINSVIATAVSDLKDGVSTEGDTLNKLYNLIQNVVGVSASATNISDRDTQKSGLVDQQNIYVTDASADATVESGWAIYKYLQPTDSFVKIAEQENIDVIVTAHATIAGYDNVLFVRETGNDTTAKFGELAYPYATPSVASQAARADYNLNGNRNLVYVLKGTYNDKDVLANHVDFEAQDGVVIYAANPNESVINDRLEVMNDVTVYGLGIYVHQFNRPYNDSEGINIRRASKFSVSAKMIDSLQVWNGDEVEFTLSNCDYITPTIGHHNNKVINFNNCRFLNGCRSGSYVGQYTEINFKDCEFIVPEFITSEAGNTSLDIYHHNGGLIFRIDPDTGTTTDPIDTAAQPDIDAVISILDTIHTNGNKVSGTECVGFMYSQNDYWFNIANLKVNHLNSTIRIKRDKCIGILLCQKKDSTVGGSPSVTFSNVRIFDESPNKNTVALVTGWGNDATVQPYLMLHGISHNCTVERKLLNSAHNPWIKTFQEIDEGQADSVTKIGTPVANQVAIWNADGIIGGNVQLTWNGSSLVATGGSVLASNFNGVALGTGGSSSQFLNAAGNYSNIDYSAVSNIPAGSANGLATLDGTGKVPAGQLPSYVDDVLEYANLAAFPATGEAGKIYVAIDTSKTYRWTGSVYVEISAASGDVTKVGTPGNNQLAVWTGDGTIMGPSGLTYDGSILTVNGDGLSVGTHLGANSVRFLKSSAGIQGRGSSVSDLYWFSNESLYTLYARAISSGTKTGILFDSQGGTDTGTNPLTSFMSRIGSSSNVNVRPLFRWYNNGTAVAEVGANGDWNYQGNSLTNIADPVNSQDAATKAYVDSHVGGLLVTNEAQNRILTSTGTGAGNAEADLTWNGNKLSISSNGSTELELDTTSSSGLSYIQLKADLDSSATIAMYGSAILGTFFGINLANKFCVLTTDSASNGMLLGTVAAHDIYIGTKNIISATIDGDTQNWIFNNKNVSGINALSASSINGVPLTNGGSATQFLNGTGNYVSPDLGTSYVSTHPSQGLTEAQKTNAQINLGVHVATPGVGYLVRTDIAGNLLTNGEFKYQSPSLELFATSANMRIKDTGGTTMGRLTIENSGSGMLNLMSYSSGIGGSIWSGLSNANKIHIEANLPFVISTSTANDLIFGTNDTLSATIDGTTQNWNLNGNDLDGIGTIYLGNSGTNGSYRLIVSGNDLLIQRRESSSWVTKSTISGT